MTPAELRANVDTIVVLILENRSFDHVLGHLRSPAYGARLDVEGIDDPARIAFLNPNNDGLGVAPFWSADTAFASDLPHDPDAVQTQLAHSDVTGSYLMTGFVKAFENEFHTSVTNPAVMALLTPAAVPVTGALAAAYTVCDHWFACLPTSTAPNRLMSMCGYSDHSDTGTFLPDQKTVYDWLQDHGVRWRTYASGLPFFSLMPRLMPLVLTSHFRRLGSLPKDMAAEGSGEWPQVIFIEPDYFDCPVHLHPPCDNHPPLAMAAGEALLAQVYAYLTADPAKWARTVFIVTYDEHGGFFDHLSPLPITYRNPNGVAFDTTGPRVPAIVAGPLAAPAVSKRLLDNTSILQLIAERFGQPGETYSAEVAGRRAQGIESVSAVLTLPASNTRTVPLNPAAVPSPSSVTVAPSAMRQSFLLAAQQLRSRHQGEALAKYQELGDLPKS